jgi:hypothetical protein
MVLDSDPAGFSFDLVNPIGHCVAIYDYRAKESGELSFMTGEKFLLFDDKDSHWWLVENSGVRGWAPASYLEMVTEAPKQIVSPSTTKEAMPPTTAPLLQKRVSKTENEPVIIRWGKKSETPPIRSSVPASKQLVSRSSGAEISSPSPPTTPALETEDLKIERSATPRQETASPSAAASVSRPLIPPKPVSLKTRSKATPVVSGPGPGPTPAPIAPLPNVGLVPTPLAFLHRPPSRPGQSPTTNVNEDQQAQPQMTREEEE